MMNQCGCDSEHVPALNRWGYRRIRERKNAEEFVAKLHKIELVGCMTSKEFRDMMERINKLDWSAEDRDDFQRLRSEADAKLREAETLSANRHYEAACGSSWTSANMASPGSSAVPGQVSQRTMTCSG
jgi:hypothetical protein